MNENIEKCPCCGVKVVWTQWRYVKKINSKRHMSSNNIQDFYLYIPVDISKRIPSNHFLECKSLQSYIGKNDKKRNSKGDIQKD